MAGIIYQTHDTLDHVDPNACHLLHKSLNPLDSLPPSQRLRSLIRRVPIGEEVEEADQEEEDPG